MAIHCVTISTVLPYPLCHHIHCVTISTVSPYPLCHHIHHRYSCPRPHQQHLHLHHHLYSFHRKSRHVAQPSQSSTIYTPQLHPIIHHIQHLTPPDHPPYTTPNSTRSSTIFTPKLHPIIPLLYQTYTIFNTILHGPPEFPGQYSLTRANTVQWLLKLRVHNIYMTLEQARMEIEASQSDYYSIANSDRELAQWQANIALCILKVSLTGWWHRREWGEMLGEMLRERRNGSR